jgi:hypothetical protein
MLYWFETLSMSDWSSPRAAARDVVLAAARQLRAAPVLHFPVSYPA